MLGVPPAFVLSQDQTLYLSCISTAFRLVEILFISIARNLLVFFSLFFDFLFYSISYSGISRVVVLFLHCSIFKMLCAVRLFCDSFNIISRFFLLVNTFFDIFFGFFVIPSPQALLEATRLLYHSSLVFVNSYFSTNIC